MASSVDPVTADLLQAQLGGAYGSFDVAARSRHVALLQSVQRAEDVALHVERGSHNHWTVTVCASDRLGVLSVIAGLFSAYRLNILNADVFTLHLPQLREGAERGRRAWRDLRRAATTTPRQPTRRILDVFEVQAPDDAGSDLWEQFREEIVGLVKLLAGGEQERAREQIIDRVSAEARARGDPGWQLFPLSIQLINDASPTLTQLTIRSQDTLGFLFSFTTALATLNVNIERAEIRTHHGEVDDTFWLTEAGGQKIIQAERVHEIRVAAALIKHFTHLLPRSPNPAQALRQFNALIHQMLSRPDWTRELGDLESTTALETLAELMGISQFLWEDFLRMQHENLFPVLLDVPALEQHKDREQLREGLRRQLHGLLERSAQVQALNRFKDREMFRIDLRHIRGGVGFREFSEELSELAEVVVGEAAELALGTLQERFGLPMLAPGRGCAWCICALGKFGGYELGFGSDVELLFVYEGEGTTGGPAAIENSLYFGDFVRAFLTTLKAQREGIFEVDLRLRPHGSAGALASTLEGFREYYAAAGEAQQFERMALVKLRPVTGDAELGAEILRWRDNFVYSGRPLDVENILHLRRRQALELVPRGAVSAKYSPGGLVDVEYFVQARQIAAGHRDAGVRVPNTLESLDRLARGGHLRDEQVGALRETYEFLRRLIDALRVVRGHARDLTIPPPDSREFAYLARRLQYQSSAQLDQAISRRMDFARRLWEEAI